MAVNRGEASTGFCNVLKIIGEPPRIVRHKVKLACHILFTSRFVRVFFASDVLANFISCFTSYVL
jgi:hypothetical protein